MCQERGIANCVLLGDPHVIQSVADEQGVTLPPGIEIIQPDQVIDEYITPMVECRKAKGLTEAAARDQLKDTVVLGTMMCNAIMSMDWYQVLFTRPQTPSALPCS